MPTNLQCKKRHQAFTLIELLVVIAIIALLAAILFPVFARARENARRASCQSNMKQMGLGIMQYLQDYDERYPLAWYGEVPGGLQTVSGMPGRTYRTYGGAIAGTTWDYHILWMDMIYPYVKSTTLFKCPSFSSNDWTIQRSLQYQMNGAYSNTAKVDYTSTTISDYATSQYRGSATTSPIMQTSTAVSAIQRPAETVMIFEARGGLTSEGLFGSIGSVVFYGQSNINNLNAHLEGMNFTYGDGHVKWMSAKQILASAGSTTGFACGMDNPNPAYAQCSRMWNPFIP